MYAYIIPILLLLFLALAIVFKKNDIIIIHISFIFVIVFSALFGLRSEKSGTDTIEYIEYFQSKLQNPDGNYRFELGFEHITSFFAIFGSDEFYIFSLTFLILIFLLISACRFKCNVAIFLVSFFCFLPGLDMITNGIRNTLATIISLLLLSFSNDRGTNIRTILVISTSSLIHKSTLMYSLVLIVSRIINIERHAKSLILFSVFLFMLANFTHYSNLFQFLSGYTSGYGIFSKFSRYLVNSDELLSPYVKLYFFVVSLTLCLYIALNNAVLVTEKEIIMAKFSFIGLIVLSAIYFIPYSYRFMLLFYPFQVLCVSIIISRQGLKASSCAMLSFIIGNAVITYATNTSRALVFLDIF
ncbi:hypothetical protein GWZ47_16590 [Vibrio cholerae]|nr:hypothetical protein [Vibrio cholerae]EGR1049374.1 hypothetical protein [Vibrio cholerae]EGR4348159.1 hypothetical protein [Vibrio cholerae]